MNRFFVYHPVFAWVIAVFIALFGVIALRLLPIEQYPQVAPPALNLQITYNGADAATLDRSVTSIIEKEMNGVDNFLYMSSTSRSNGTAQITVTFQPGTDLDTARTQVQDRLSRVEPRLPQEVLYRPKMGFAVPLARWFRGPLRGRVREALTGDRLSSTGMFDRRYLQELIDHHESGRRDYSAPLWTLLMFDAFLRNVMDGSTAVPVTEKAA